MKETRWLLPFTFGVDKRAIDLVFRMAEHCDATLVAASLIILPDPEQGRELLVVRLQQSKEFLETVQVKTTQYQVPVEPHEIWTSDAQERMKRLVLDLQCDSIVLVTEGKDGVLLRAHEMDDILMGGTRASIMLVRLHVSNKGTIMTYLRTWFFSWLRKLRGQDRAPAELPVAPVESESERGNVSG